MQQRQLKKKVKQFHLSKNIHVILCIFIFLSCTSYKPYRLVKKIKVYSDNKKINNRESIAHRVHITKYFLLYDKNHPVTRIINKAIVLCTSEKHAQALIILYSVLRANNKSGIIHNNIAIVYESMNNRKSAEKHYLTASVKLPENTYIRKNYLSFIESTFHSNKQHHCSAILIYN